MVQEQQSSDRTHHSVNAIDVDISDSPCPSHGPHTPTESSTNYLHPLDSVLDLLSKLSPPPILLLTLSETFDLGLLGAHLQHLAVPGAYMHLHVRKGARGSAASLRDVLAEPASIERGGTRHALSLDARFRLCTASNRQRALWGMLRATRKSWGLEPQLWRTESGVVSLP